VITDGQSIVHLASRLTLALLIVSIALTFIRLVRGPQAVDRVVSLDLIAVMIVAFLGAYAVHVKDTSFLDVAIAYALIAFLGTVALARYLLRSRRRPKQRPTDREEE
jgi:multicomponent Na+:H+ antiporter subunit F